MRHTDYVVVRTRDRVSYLTTRDRIREAGALLRFDGCPVHVVFSQVARGDAYATRGSLQPVAVRADDVVSRTPPGFPVPVGLFHHAMRPAA